MAHMTAEFTKVRAASEYFLVRARRIAERIETLATSMDMQFLYDADRGLFAIGYQVGAPLTFSSHYDLLASESRLASLVAIAKGQVPVHNWLALGAPYTPWNGLVLPSWTGLMLDY